MQAPPILKFIRLSVWMLFFAAYFLYLLLYIRPEFLYYAFITDGGYIYPPFLTGWIFFMDFLIHPGGPAFYCSSFLFQSYGQPLIGSAVVTALAATAFGVSRSMLRRFYGVPLNAIALFPVVVSGIIITRYGDPIPLLVSYCLIMGISDAYIALVMEKTPRHYAFFPLFFSTFFFVTGGTVILFSLIVVLYAWQNGRKGVQTLVSVLCSIAAAWAVCRYFDMRCAWHYFFTIDGYPTNRIFGNTKLFVDAYIATTNAGIVSLAAIAPLAKTRWVQRILAAVSRPSTADISTAAGILICALCLFFSRDGARRSKIELEYFSRLGKWENIISLVEKNGPSRLNKIALFDVNSALYHTGGLGEKMFAYPQRPDALYFDDPEIKYRVPVLIRNARLYYELGCLNLSKSCLCELFEGSRIEHPYVLEQLANIALVQDRPALAEMWYTRLSKDVVYGRRARKALSRLHVRAHSGNADGMDSPKANALVHDTVVTGLDLRGLCLAALEKNAANRTALEYLIGAALLSGDLSAFCNYLPRCKEAGYVWLPRHWAEALALQIGMHPDSSRQFLNLVPLTVQARFGNFMESFIAIRKNCVERGTGSFLGAAAGALRERCGASYFFYYFFHQSGEPRWYGRGKD